MQGTLPWELPECLSSQSFMQGDEHKPPNLPSCVARSSPATSLIMFYFESEAVWCPGCADDRVRRHHPFQ